MSDSDEIRDDIPALVCPADYEAIADYAVIGDCRSAALVSRTGSIDWLCMPDFSSPSLFAALLDRRRGGRWVVRPRQVLRIERRYRGRSAVLETTFHCAAGSLRLTDFMPLRDADEAPLMLLRLAECVEGEVVVEVACQPRPDYAQTPARIDAEGDGHWSVAQGGRKVRLSADFPLEIRSATTEEGGEGDFLAGRRPLAAGERCCLSLVYPSSSGTPSLRPGADPAQQLAATVGWWEAWCAQGNCGGPHGEIVLRSLLTLKLLTHHRTGGVVAAVTTSLPESLEAGRNWDYRYCWLRDTSLLLQSFIDVGFRRESEAFLGWLLRVERKPDLQPLYTVQGGRVPDEKALPHLEGYRGCGPVRIGNSAHRQLQLDIYGEVVQTAASFVARGGPLNGDEKKLLASLGEAVCRLWREPDQSIWEARSPPRHYTYSKLMCWVALDRLIGLNRCLPLNLDEGRLRRERRALRRAIERGGFDRRLHSYVGHFGGREPDASLLLMLRYGYLSHDDARIQGTYRYIASRLAVDGLLYRYPPGEAGDGVAGRENLFAACSFWEVDFLARSGELDAAERLLERLVALANEVGLYAEQFDTHSGTALGNFPQAFTHAGLVTAALAIEQGRKGKRGRDIAS